MANGTIAFDTLSTSGQISGTAKSVDTDFVVSGSAKCWANLDFSNATILQNSFGLGSFTDNGNGAPQLNFAATLESAKFCLTATHDVYSERAGAVESSDDRGNTTALCKARVSDASGNAEDSREVMMVIHGDLA